MKAFFVSLLSFLVLDAIWLGFIMKDFNLRQLSDIGRIEDGVFRVWYLPAAGTYLLMAIAITVFVFPRTAALPNYFAIFGYGALLGLIVYGVFDLTNLAILKNYPVPFVVADVAWGATVFGMVTVLNRVFES